MAKRVLLCLVIVLSCFVGTTYAQTGKLSGKVTEKANKGAPIPGVNVVVKLNGAVKGTGITDEKGFYSVSPLVPGSYTVEFINMAFATVKIGNVPIEVDKTRYLNSELVEAGVDLGDEVIITGYKIPIIDPGGDPTANTLDNAAIMKLPTRDVTTLASTTPGVFAADDNAALNLKGARSSQTIYYVNGVKQLGGAPNIPTSAIAQLTVVTGGVPAQYGDAVGGIINITTSSPSSKYSGGVEAETSNLFDKYKNNLVNFNLSGPLLKRKADDGSDKGSLLGFFLAGQYQSSQDDSPLYRGLYQVKSDKLAEIQAKPFVYSQQTGSVQRSAELLRLDDLEKVKVRPNADSRRQSVNASFDFQPIDNILFSFGGSYDRYRQDLFQGTGALLNSANNPRRFTTNWNTFARFTQNFGNSGEGSLLKNSYYQVQGDFTRFDRVIQDERYKDDLAQYGYVGKFSEQTRSQLIPIDTLTRVVDGVRYPYAIQFNSPNGVNFTAAPNNPLLANYNNQLLTDGNLGNNPVSGYTSLISQQGMLNGFSPNLIQNVYSGTGGPWNQYLLQKNDQYRLTALGSTEIGKHTVKLGLEFEQRIESFYDARPQGLWNTARGLANSHIARQTGLGDITLVDGYATQQLVDASNGLQESSYSVNLRRRLGYTDAQRLTYINIDELSPDQIRLEDFTAEDALRQGLVSSYQGYTYLGKRNTAKKVAFSDFFTDVQNRPQDAYRPTYAAAFVEDKFAIEDMILRVGLRIDRFDANQRVLKDKYSLVDVSLVKDIDVKSFANGADYQRPSNIGDDFVPYVDSDPETGGDPNRYRITGYRNGDVFYTADGRVTENIQEIQGGGKAYPYFRVPAQGSQTRDASLEYIKDQKLSLRAFRDYKPQINVMPRVSFSFPISEDAMFFAHYDILTQRPENNPTRPSDYFYLKGSVFGSDINSINNPDLKPQRKIDMQVGFQQRLTQSSGLTISAFYSELRDLIQYRPVFGAYPTDYITFANIDFGTVKGMTLEYDLRRTKNIAFNASYTLQFAKGTGSNSTSGFNLASQGVPNLRVPIPLDYDQRNQVKASLDFRYADGEGPIAFGQRFLQNAGINILVQGGSGTPYSQQQNITQAVSIGVQQRAALKGQLNGSRLPASARVSLRLDKDFALKVGGKQVPVLKTLNVYIRAQNLLNSANTLNVFRYTGSAEDDGFLSDYQTRNSSNTSPLYLSQVDLYQARLFQNTNYSLPRRMWLGATLTF
jgi:Carboxypeptidase regulatory-like domain/TonB-dependent Receptor Plug Domain